MRAGMIHKLEARGYSPGFKTWRARFESPLCGVLRDPDRVIGAAAVRDLKLACPWCCGWGLANRRAENIVSYVCVCNQLFIIPLHIDPMDHAGDASRRVHLCLIPSPTGNPPQTMWSPAVIVGLTCLLSPMPPEKQLKRKQRKSSKNLYLPPGAAYSPIPSASSGGVLPLFHLILPTRRRPLRRWASGWGGC